MREYERVKHLEALIQDLKKDIGGHPGGSMVINNDAIKEILDKISNLEGLLGRYRAVFQKIGVKIDE